MKTCKVCKRSYVYKAEKDYTGKSKLRCPPCQLKFEKPVKKDAKKKL